MEGISEDLSLWFFLILTQSLFWGCYLEFRDAVPSFILRTMVIIAHSSMMGMDIFLATTPAFKMDPTLIPYTLCIQVVGEILMMFALKFIFDDMKKQKSKQ